MEAKAEGAGAGEADREGAVTVVDFLRFFEVFRATVESKE